MTVRRILIFECQEMKYLLKCSFQPNYYFPKESERTVKCFTELVRVVRILLDFKETGGVRKHFISVFLSVCLSVYPHPLSILSSFFPLIPISFHFALLLLKEK